MHFQFNIASHVMRAQEEVELHQHHVMTHWHGIGVSEAFWCSDVSDISGFHVFHMALKFQYLHTPVLRPCTFALATLKTPGGSSNPGVEATTGGNSGQQCLSTTWRLCPTPQPVAPSAPAAPASGAPPVVLRARREDVVVVPDDSDSGAPGVSGVSGKKRPGPKKEMQSQSPRQCLHACKRALHLQEGLRLRQNLSLLQVLHLVFLVLLVLLVPSERTRDPLVLGGKWKIARSAASSSSAAGGSSGGNISFLRKPLQGHSFVIYSSGKTQASNKDFMSPSLKFDSAFYFLKTERSC